MKKISVIIPVYNIERYITETIYSVLKQTYQHFEIIIVDDGSSDQSIKICQQFTDPRIKIICQANRGLAGARNTGIRNAKSDYIAFLDGDDLWLPEKLEKHIKHLDNSPMVGISFSRSGFINETGHFLESYQMPKLKNITPDLLLRCNPIGNGSAPVIRREVLEAIQFQDTLHGLNEDFYFDEQFRRAEDIELWLRIIIQTPWKIEGIPEVLTLYRVNTQGLSANLQQQLEAWEKVIQKTKSYASDLIKCNEKSAKAYRLQILARSAIRQKSGSIAVNLFNQAFITYWLIVIKIPYRMLLTGIAAYLLWLLPQAYYTYFENFALKSLSIWQKICIFYSIKLNNNSASLSH